VGGVAAPCRFAAIAARKFTVWASLLAVGAAVWSQKEHERGSCPVAIGPRPWGGRLVRGPAVVAGCVAYTQRLPLPFLTLSLIPLFCSYSQEHSREEKLSSSPLSLI
jgi:hypothetical protein